MLANDLKVGNVILHQGKLWVVTKTNHTQPGKGGAYIQAEMKELKHGTKTNVRFRSSEPVEKAFLDEKECQYLYTQGDEIYLMDGQTFEQMSIKKDVIGDQVVLLKEGVNLRIRMYESDVVAATIVGNVIMKVEECEPVVKGQTATSSYKPAVVLDESGTKRVKIMVPQFVDPGELIEINPETMEYIKKHKSN